ncbi:hypothetical protein HYT33_04165 [Candidatus Roizmanbacteria bacterium]|nr:hypothetical protein [Candidatus Roizmanbacteria bacterium]
MTKVENPLSQFGINPQLENTRLDRLQTPEEKTYELFNNLKAYQNEVLDDSPVSVKYSYWFGEYDELFTHPSRKKQYVASSQFDMRERDGVPALGFRKVTTLLAKNPDKMVLWYSPPGEASFDDDPENPFSDITFHYGQWYIQWADSQSGEVTAFALKVRNAHAVARFMPGVFQQAKELEGKERIIYLLSHPIVWDGDIRAFLLSGRTKTDYLYSNFDGDSFRIADVFSEIEERILAEDGVLDDAVFKLAQTTASQPNKEDSIFKAYLTMIRDHQRQTGKETIRLSGSCGGRAVSGSEIETLLGLSNPFSSSFRALTQSKEGSHYPSYECPHCGKILSGESKTDRASRRHACDYCGGKLNC